MDFELQWLLIGLPVAFVLGWVAERRPDPRDRRAQLVAATAKARQLLPRLDKAMDRLNAEADAAMGGDRAQLQSSLRRLGTEANWSRDV